MTIPIGIPIKNHTLPIALIALPCDFDHRRRTQARKRTEVKNVAVCCQESDSDALNLEDLAEMLGGCGCGDLKTSWRYPKHSQSQ